MSVFHARLLPVQRKLIECRDYFAGIYSSRAAGKTYALSVLAAKALCEGRNSMLWAQTKAALHNVIFAEVKKRLFEWGAGAAIEVNESRMSIDLNDRFIRTFSYENIDACRGESEISEVDFDEIALAPVPILATVVPCMRGLGIHPRIRFASTPKIGSFWDVYLFDPRNSITIFRGSLFENSFVSKEQVDAMKMAITDEALYRQEIMGEIIEDADATRIIKPTDFVNAAPAADEQMPVIIGADCSGLGVDMNFIRARQGNLIVFDFSIREADGPFLAAKITNFAAGLTGGSRIRELNIDEAYGNSLYDCSKVQPFRVNRIAFGGRPADGRFANKRTEMYFRLAEAVRGGLYIPDSRTREELLATHYTLDSRGKIILQKKSEIKEIIGRSPDASDALALTFATERAVEQQIRAHREKEDSAERARRFMGEY